MLQFRQAVSSFRFRQQSIHLREKNIAGPSLRDQQCCALLSSQIGPAFFDEDDASGRIQELPYSLSELLPSLYAVGFFHVDRQASYLGIFHCPHYFIRVFPVDVYK